MVKCVLASLIHVSWYGLIENDQKHIIKIYKKYEPMYNDQIQFINAIYLETKPKHTIVSTFT